MQESWSFELPNCTTLQDGLEAVMLLKQIELGIFLSYYYKNYKFNLTKPYRFMVF